MRFGRALEWRENDEDGTICSYAVVYDTPIAALQADQPFNCAVIDLDHAPGINSVRRLRECYPARQRKHRELDLVSTASRAPALSPRR